MNCVMPLFKDEMSEGAVTWKVKNDAECDPVEMLCQPVLSKPESWVASDRV